MNFGGMWPILRCSTPEWTTRGASALEPLASTLCELPGGHEAPKSTGRDNGGSFGRAKVALELDR